MLQSNQPTKIQLPFANSGQKNAIPVPSQTGMTPGAASFTDGFPPLTMTAISAGGIPPSGKDFNGILNAITAILQWECGGGFFTYDSAWSSANGGYPKGAVLQSVDGNDLWLNQVDGNTSNPDATDGSAANWVSLAAYGIGAVTGLTNTNVTLTPAQYSMPIITLAGALTGNVQIIAPTAQREYVFINNTTGAFTVTVKPSAGTGVAIPQGQLQSVYCDGTNVNPLHAPAVGNAAQTFQVAAATQPTHAINQITGDGRYLKQGSSGIAGRQAFSSWTPASAASHTLTATFTAPVAGTVICISLVNSSPQTGCSITNQANINSANTVSDQDTLSSTSITMVAVAAGASVTVNSIVSTSAAASVALSQYLNYLFIPS